VLYTGVSAISCWRARCSRSRSACSF